MKKGRYRQSCCAAHAFQVTLSQGYINRRVLGEDVNSKRQYHIPSPHKIPTNSGTVQGGFG